MADIYSFQRVLSRRLLIWGGGSTVAGLFVGLLFTNPLIRGVALHAVAWGLIDSALAGWGFRRARRESRLYPDEYRDIHHTQRLRRLLKVNAGLDIGYITGGVAVAALFREDPYLLGNGIGIIIQALFLFVFDLTHTLLLPKTVPTWYDPPS